MESGAGNILVTEEISASVDTLGAMYEVLGRILGLGILLYWVRQLVVCGFC